MAETERQLSAKHTYCRIEWYSLTTELDTVGRSVRSCFFFFFTQVKRRFKKKINYNFAMSPIFTTMTLFH